MTALDNPKFASSQAYFAAACCASRIHSAYVASSLAKYGDGDGVSISGCARDHFPDHVKDDLRHWAREVTRLSNLAYENKPKRSQHSTIVALGRAVATREGSGFYGPQPNRS